MFTIKHENITHSNRVVVPNNVKIGTISPSHHLSHFEYTEKKPIVEVSNNNGLKIVKRPINTSNWYVHAIRHLRNLCLLSSNGMV